MKTINKIEAHEINDELNLLWENNRQAILKTAGVVAVVAVVATAFFLGRTRMLNALLSSKLYQSGMDQLHRLADTAGAVKHKVMDVANSVTHKFADREGISTLN